MSTEIKRLAAILNERRALRLKKEQELIELLQQEIREEDDLISEYDRVLLELNNPCEVTVEEEETPEEVKPETINEEPKPVCLVTDEAPTVIKKKKLCTKKTELAPELSKADMDVTNQFIQTLINAK